MSDDTISRKATIDAMENVDWYHISKDGQLTHGANSKEDEPLYKAEDVYKVLNDMPSAQPETHEERTETHACDLISRQAAIELVKDVCDAIMSGCESWYDPETEDEVYTDIREVDAILKCNKEVRIALRNMPSAQPDQGKYEYHYDHTDCIWYRPEARNRCPVTCAQYRDGWNDAMNYIFRDGKGYRPYIRGKQYEE